MTDKKMCGKGLHKEDAGRAEGALKVRDSLMALRDIKYRDFQSALVPNIDPQTVIGVRMPLLRRLAGQLAGSREAEEFLLDLPHAFYDENVLHGKLIEKIRDYDRCMAAVEAFLPYVDNWAVCDTMSPRVFGRHRPQLLEKIRVWLEDSHPYTVRFGIGMLMSHFLDEDFDPAQMEWVVAVHSEEYYVNMMRAWYFATALAKQYDAAYGVIRDGKLELWTHNKAIQKAVESRRITDEQKEALRALRQR